MSVLSRMRKASLSARESVKNWWGVRNLVLRHSNDLILEPLEDRIVMDGEVSFLQNLTADDGLGGDTFGSAVSSDGQWFIVGAPQDDDHGLSSGSAYLYRFADGLWGETQKITASDGEEGDLFGRWVAIEGDYALVGAEQDDDHGSNSGAVYVYHLENGTWVETQKLTASDGSSWDRFGGSGDISGDYAVIGAAYDDDKDFASGSAYLFHLENGSWVEVQKLIAPDSGRGDLFGASVSLQGNHLIVGAAYNDQIDSNAGAVYLYRLDSGMCSLEQKLVASDGSLGDCFGSSVSIFGDYAIVGAAYDALAQESVQTIGPEAGSAYIFHKVDGVWIQEQRITASYAGNYDHFGISVSLSGEYAVVGAYQDDSWGTDAGNVYLFRLQNGAWVEQEMLQRSEAGESDWFWVQRFYGWASYRSRSVSR
ncbi:FG-GAP repeat protein [Desulfomonile tiedjei]|uniref:FG-GAP repeat protein n=1 Tax=Desulfomonile tiedjei (strain ATCC 49306 / DSM 6799 / DCB-1) TaxID=706587 RepID=I4CDX8_DESTA|nr:FG-GAP repeat protein [Desulfomonile tiedjei]AFM27769.1 hypothetical protein Desti_5167 [Desulfomonile tiedjei DSM 6799]